MEKFYCGDIACGHCVSRIDTALTEAKIEHQVDLESKIVSIQGDNTVVGQAKDILEDLGFTPEPAH